MGRTVPTFTNILDQEVESWSKFRHALRAEDRDAFDEIFRAAKHHLAENFYSMRTVPFESIIMSVAVEQQKRLQRLEERMAHLEKGVPNNETKALTA